MARPGKPWWYAAKGRWAATVGGVRRLAPVGIGRRDERTAWAWYDSLGTEGRPVPAGVVAAACEAYLAWDHARAVRGARSLKSHAGTRSQVDRICDAPTPGGLFGSLPIAAVRADHLDALDAGWAASGLAPGYRRALIATVLAVFRWAARPVEGRAAMIPASPFAGAKLPPVPRAAERYATRAEAAAWLRWLWRRGRRDVADLQRALIHTGARPSELTGATWGEVEWRGDGPAILTRVAWKSARKTGRPRRVYLPRRLHRMLRRREAAGGPLLFATERGRPWSGSALSMQVVRLREAAIKDGVPIRGDGPDRLTCYRWRHTAITSLITQNVPIAVVAELMGTSAQMIATTYAHILTGHLSDAAESLANKRSVK